MEMLYKRNLYNIAISLARAQNLGSREIADIFKEYGDHLYSKGDYDRAIIQYIETIKDGKTFIEPSYIIRKFLDSQRIDNLTKYLEALHANKCANKDHTTLLLNCFTKSKDTAKLDNFIRESTNLEKSKGEGPNFDVDTAIHVCRQAGHYNHAIRLASQHGKHGMYLKILIEDSKDFPTAIEHIYSLKLMDAENLVKQYGQEMMLERPDLTTELLKKLCTDFRKISDSKESEVPGKVITTSSDVIHRVSFFLLYCLFNFI